MTLKINPKIKYNPNKERISEDVFNVLSTYFDIDSEISKKNGRSIFNYDYKKIKFLSDEELSQIACYIIPFMRHSFTKPKEAMELYTIFDKRNIDPEEFAIYAREFNIPELGELSSELVNKIRWLLKRKEKIADYWGIPLDPYRKKVEYKNYISILNEFNKKKTNPVKLENIINLESTPVAMRFDDKGFLYMLDKKGILNKFDRNTIIKKYNLQLDLSYVSSDKMGEFLEEGVQLLPNIFINQNLLFFTSAYGIKIFELDKQLSSSKEVIKSKNSLSNSLSDYRYHDCIVKDNYILVSFSNFKNRFIAVKTEN